jgi:hypothetical protein
MPPSQLRRFASNVALLPVLVLFTEDSEPDY